MDPHECFKSLQMANNGGTPAIIFWTMSSELLAATYINNSACLVFDEQGIPKAAWIAGVTGRFPSFRQTKMRTSATIAWIFFNLRHHSRRRWERLEGIDLLNKSMKSSSSFLDWWPHCCWVHILAHIWGVRSSASPRCINCYRMTYPKISSRPRLISEWNFCGCVHKILADPENGPICRKLPQQLNQIFWDEHLQSWHAQARIHV